MLNIKIEVTNIIIGILIINLTELIISFIMLYLALKISK